MKLLAVVFLAILVGFLIYLGTDFRKKISQNNSIDAQKQAEALVKKCQNSPNWSGCYSRELISIIEVQEFKKVLGILEIIKGLDEKTKDCHFIAHDLARVMSLRNSDDWDVQLSFVDSSCRGGFIHGLIEARNIREPSFKLDSGLVTSICRKLKTNINPEDPIIEQACAHTMGHVLVAELEGDLEKSVEVCDQTPENIRYLCHSGIFMENITKSSLVAHGLSTGASITKDSALTHEELCRRFKGIAAKACWREAAHNYLTLTSNNLEQSGKLCNVAKESEYIDACALHVSALLAPTPEITTGELGSLCSFFGESKEKFRNCISEVTMSLVATSANFVGKADLFCEAQPEEFRQKCHSGVKYTRENVTFKYEE